MQSEYREHIEPDSQTYLSDRSILEHFAGHDRASPVDVARGRRRENVLRLQCRDLSRVGFLRECSHDGFTITTQGLEFLPGRPEAMTDDGLVKSDALVGSARPNDGWSLSSFDILDAETIKWINRDEFESSDRYGLEQNDRSLTEQRIRNVPERRIRRIIRGFPRSEPLPQQCAHWMRAFAGLHLFPDANHRTGMNTLQILVGEADVDAELPLASDLSGTCYNRG
ncbi:MAG: hypothetical protein ABEJ79_00960 [Halolamina sp.]